MKINLADGKSFIKTITDDELLVKALAKLGWRDIKNGIYWEGELQFHPNYPQVWGVPPRSCTGDHCRVPRLLVSLDAHNTQDSTIEYMAKRGFLIEIWQRGDGLFSARFDHTHRRAMYSGQDKSPAHAVTKAFVQHEEL